MGLTDHVNSGNGTPGPAPEAARVSEADVKAYRQTATLAKAFYVAWENEQPGGTAIPREYSYVRSLAYAVEQLCARAELARAPNLIERDRVWCTALNESGLTPSQMNQVTTRFNILRADAERPPQERPNE